jgi:toxin YoeB
VKVLWTESALHHYQWWEASDQKMVERIKALIADIERCPFDGLGRPEPLKFGLAGWWSRRITGEHRLVYKVEGNPAVLTITQCMYHY